MPVVTALAMRYADELSQNYYNVMSVMERMYSQRVTSSLTGRLTGSRSDLLHHNTPPPTRVASNTPTNQVCTAELAC